MSHTSKLFAASRADPAIHIHGTALELLTPGASALRIHPLWLRERCADPASLDPRTGQRLYNPSDLDPDIALATLIETGADGIAVTFSDGHEADFDRSTLIAEIVAERGGDAPAREGWTGRLDPLPVFDWTAEPEPDRLFAMLERFLALGFIVLKGVAARDRAVLDVARRFGFPRETNFGVMFDVRSEPDATDLAYTSLALDPHTDNPYRAPVPGIQLLHCLTNRGSGGLSTLVDGLAVADALAAEAPDEAAILARTPVRFRYADSDTELVAAAPLVAREADGRFRAIHYSPRLDLAPLLAQDELTAFYRARRKLDGLLRSDRFALRFKLADGDLMMFDNRRLLHGRTGFDPAEGLRHLQGCYIDQDGPLSLYRVLRRRLRATGR